MNAETVALVDKPLLLALVLAVGAIMGMAIERAAQRAKRAARRAGWRVRRGRPADGRGSASGAAKGGAQYAAPDAAEQLRRVMEADFKARPLLNRPERRLLSVVDEALATQCPGWRVMGQVSLGEILSSEDRNAYFAVNSKRVDLLIVDGECRPLHAIELQGAGHHLGSTAAARDAVKKEALRRAGIGYFEVVVGDTPAMVRERLRRLVGRSISPPRRTSRKDAAGAAQLSIRARLGI